MHRIDGPAAAPGGLFTEGDPNVGTPATVVTDDWLNTVQMELENVATAAGAALSKPNNAQVLQAIQALIARAVPPGAVQAFAMSAVPTGWLKCAGQVVSRGAYAALFTAIGTTYGAGDGSTTFGLPDLRGEFVRGFDDGRGVDAGRAMGSAQAHLTEAHVHPLSDAILTEGVPGGGLGGSTSGTSGVPVQTGSFGGTETRPRNVSLLYCIKT